ncbi:MAG: hypothetical protein GY926_19570 [bacterium]|nr:hypothetical protein [bacterium]
MMCEKCWGDAYGGGYFDGCETQTERYHQLLDERAANPCSPEEQAGQYWDPVKQVDTRAREPQEGDDDSA